MPRLVSSHPVADDPEPEDPVLVDPELPLEPVPVDPELPLEPVAVVSRFITVMAGKLCIIILSKIDDLTFPGCVYQVDHHSCVLTQTDTFIR